MNTYGKFRPTGFDGSGSFLPERQNWLVVPVSQTRDSGPLDQSNFSTALAILGGESSYVEVHRFGHWGPGWFEIIIISPTAIKTIAKADDIERSLEDYPVLDDEDFSQRESDEYNEGWNNYAESDFRSGLVKAFDLYDAAEDLLSADGDRLREFYESLRTSGEYYSGESDGVHIFTDHAVKDCTRAQLAAFLRECRNSPVAA